MFLFLILFKKMEILLFKKMEIETTAAAAMSWRMPFLPLSILCFLATVGASAICAFALCYLFIFFILTTV